MASGQVRILLANFADVHASLKKTRQPAVKFEEVETILKNLAADNLNAMKENGVTIYTVLQGHHDVLYVPAGFIVVEHVIKHVDSCIHGARLTVIMQDDKDQQVKSFQEIIDLNFNVGRSTAKLRQCLEVMCSKA